MILNSYAKLNLYLEVLNRRKDGYHNIVTLFERIDLADKITLTETSDGKIHLQADSSQIPKDKSNLAWRAAALLKEEFCPKKGAAIKICKKIPVGSGMGGGSSNAASVLKGLNKLWKLNLSTAALARLAERIGSDVPFFIYDRPFALGESKGGKIKVISVLRKARFWHILAVPRINVSTVRVYGKWDEKNVKNNAKGRLTRPLSNVKILTSALKKKDLFGVKQSLFNSLEEITAGVYPEIIAVKEKFRQLGLRPVLMSGSGPTVFAILSSRKEAVSIYRRLCRYRSWRVFVTRTR